MTRGVTLDAGALIALDRDDRRVIALLARAQATSARVTIPTTALAQAVRNPARQARLARLVRQPATDVVALDRVDATGVGRILAASGTADVVDAHVVLCAGRAGQAVVTSDPDDLHQLDPTLSLVTVSQRRSSIGRRSMISQSSRPQPQERHRSRACDSRPPVPGDRRERRSRRFRSSRGSLPSDAARGRHPARARLRWRALGSSSCMEPRVRGDAVG